MSWYDTKQTDGEVPWMLEFVGIWSIPSLLSLQCPRWHKGVASDRFLSMDQKELKWVFELNLITWSRTVLKRKLRSYAKTELFEIELFDQMEQIEIEMFLTIKLCTYI